MTLNRERICARLHGDVSADPAPGGQMTVFNWATNASGEWNTGSLWSGGIVPNSVSSDATIDATATLVPYTVTIAAGETETVHSLSMNAVDNYAQAEYPYINIAAELELDGTLIFAAGSAGTFA